MVLALAQYDMNVPGTKIAPAPSSAGITSVLIRARAFPVEAGNVVPAENASRVRAVRAAGVHGPMFPMARVHVSIHAVQTHVAHLSPHVAETGPITPAPVLQHPAGQARNVPALPA